MFPPWNQRMPKRQADGWNREAYGLAIGYFAAIDRRR
jgi:hypothetical protein